LPWRISAAGYPKALAGLDYVAGQAVELRDLLDDQAGVRVGIGAFRYGPQGLAWPDDDPREALLGRAGRR
jgi:ethanolamine utilization protein EutQ (cupin superfamily)